MKYKTLLLSILAMLCLFIPVSAEINDDNTVNIYEWSFKMLTCKSDQDSHTVVSKYYKSKNHDEVAFCIEPNQDFLPVGSKYTKKINDNEKIYKIVKAYNQLDEKDDNYFIAAQLLIWEETSGISYTFKGDDYQEYKQILLDIINPKPLLKSLSPPVTIESYVGEKVTLDEDYSEYNVETEGIEIIENNSEHFIYKIAEEEPILKTINFTPIDSDDSHSYVYESETSQDIYHYDGEYSDLKPFTLNVKSLKKPQNITINYSKKDEFNNPISGAKFSVYEKDCDNADNELIFIHKNVDINLFEAVLGDYSSYTDLSIKVSERYDQYLNDEVINAKEIGYFPYKIFDNQQLIKEGIIYVTNNTDLSSGSYSKSSVRDVFSGFSEDLQINSINNLEPNKTYYLCESEPKKGYTYACEPCVIVDANVYNGQVYEFINSTRTYTLRLMKQSPEEVLLDGAKFKITYLDDSNIKEIYFTTGYLNIDRHDNNKYLIYKHENDITATIVEFSSDSYAEKVEKSGKYYYYQSNSNEIDDSLLDDDYITVMQGGFIIENMPYSSSITVEELQAPKGFIITEPIYHITPDISYSEITFKNYRINSFDILPAKKFKIPKTCIDES